MRFYTAFATDVGTKKQINQDSISVKNFATPIGSVALAVLCDGMGGFSHGEVASRSIVFAFENWAEQYLPILAKSEIYDGDIRRHWTELIAAQNKVIRNFGKQNGFRIGSTVTTMLLTETRYFILNIGDSRAYKINSLGAARITTDHTIVENEIELGNMTEAQALNSPMRSVLTKCVGISETVEPDMFFGDIEHDTVYMLCSDGFRHLISPDEMKTVLYCGIGSEPESLGKRVLSLIDLNKQREETDNISAVIIYVK